MTQKAPELYLIEAPERVERKVLQLSGPLRAAGPAGERPVGRPWPRQHLWRERLRRLKKAPD